MQVLSEMIIERLNDIHQMKIVQQKAPVLLDDENEGKYWTKKMQHMITQIEKRQNQRVKAQLVALNDLQKLKLTSEQRLKEFLTVSITVFCAHNPSFQQNIQMKDNESMSSKTHRLYRQFLLKHANTFHYAHICSYLRKQACQLNPAIYLGWIGEWSRGLLAQTLKKWGSSSESIRLRTELNKITIGQQKPKENDLLLQTREHFYAYLLPELEEYYKKFQFLGLDLAYLRSIKPLGQKEQLFRGKNLNHSISFLISKSNSNIANLNKRYYQSYSKLKKRSRILTESESVIKHRTIDSSISKQELIQQAEDSLLYRAKQPKKQKILLRQPCKRIQFPLIQPAFNHNKSGISPSKPKKHIRLSYKTQSEEYNQPIFSIRSSAFQRSISSKQPQMHLQEKKSQVNCVLNVFNEYKLIQNKFQNRRKSIIQKIKEKQLNSDSKGEKITVPSSRYLDYPKFQSNRRQRYFFLQKLCK